MRMWILLVGVAVGYPLWRAYWTWDAKRFRRNVTQENSQLWLTHADVEGGHETRCVHFPSMIMEERLEREGVQPRSRLFHVRRNEDGQWQRALTRQFRPPSEGAELAESARPQAPASDDKAWEPFGEPALEEAYQRFAREHQIEGAHQDGIPRRTRRSMTLPTVR